MLGEGRTMILVCVWLIATAILNGKREVLAIHMKWFRVVPLLIAITGLGALASVAKTQSTRRIGWDV